MKMEKQIQSICQSVNFHLRGINSATDEATMLFVHALIASKLDCCNSLLHGLPDQLINRLQHLQNIAARVVSHTSKFKHITPVMYELHWLPVSICIRFKLMLLMYQCVQQTAPSYLCEPLYQKGKKRQMRNSQLWTWSSRHPWIWDQNICLPCLLCQWSYGVEG